MSVSAGRRRSRSRRRWPWLAAGLVLAALLVAAGVALGMALHDNPRPNLIVTTTKTIVP